MELYRSIIGFWAESVAVIFASRLFSFGWYRVRNHEFTFGFSEVEEYFFSEVLGFFFFIILLINKPTMQCNRRGEV